MNPKQILTPNSHKILSPAVAGFLRRLKILKKGNSKKVGAILLWTLALTGAAKVIAESEVSSTSSQADKTYKQEVTLKDGKKISFAELSKLSDDELKLTLAGSDRVERILFKEWRTKEIEKDNARKDAEIKEIEKDTAQIHARRLEAEKKATANITQLESTVRKVLSAGGKLSKDHKETLESIIAFGRPPETVKYFKEVVSNPNNFVGAK